MPRNVAIGLGLMEFPFDSVAGYWRWVDLCEAGGVDLLWQTDRLISREPILECMSVMAALAGRTRRLKFGVNVLSLALRDPVLVAKQCATIDFLVRRAAVAGVRHRQPARAGMAALNLDTKTRGRKTDEGLEIIRRLWSEDKVDFEGVHYHLSGASIARSRCSPICRCGSAARPRRRSGAPRDSAPAGRPAARRPRTSAPWSPRSARPPSPKAARSTTTITAPAFRSASAGPTIPALERLLDAYRKRTGRDPLRLFRDRRRARRSSTRIADYVEAGVSKFILRPAATRRRRAHGADPPPDRRGAAAGRGALAKDQETARLRRRISLRSARTGGAAGPRIHQE